MTQVQPTPTATEAVHNPVTLYDGLTASKELMNVAYIHKNGNSVIGDERVVVESFNGESQFSVIFPRDFYLNWEEGHTFEDYIWGKPIRRVYAEFMAKKLPPGRTLEGVNESDLYYDVVKVNVAHSYDDLIKMLLQLIIGPN